MCKATGSHQWLIYAVQTGIATQWLHVSIFGFVAIFVPFYYLWKPGKVERRELTLERYRLHGNARLARFPESQEPTLSDSRSSDEHAIRVDTTSSQLPIIDDTTSQDSMATIWQCRDAKHAHWQSWQVCFLLSKPSSCNHLRMSLERRVDTAWDCLQAESFTKIGISPVQIALTPANWVGYARRCKGMHSAVARSSFTLMVGHWIHNGDLWYQPIDERFRMTQPAVITRLE